MLSPRRARTRPVRDRAWRGDTTFRMTSLIVDPSDGKIPPLTAEAQSKRIVRGTWGNGPHDGPEDFTLYDSMHYTGRCRLSPSRMVR